MDSAQPHRRVRRLPEAVARCQHDHTAAASSSEGQSHRDCAGEAGYSDELVIAAAARVSFNFFSEISGKTTKATEPN